MQSFHPQDALLVAVLLVASTIAIFVSFWWEARAKVEVRVRNLKPAQGIDLDAAIAAGVPTIFRGGFTQSWSAQDRWKSAKRLAKHLADERGDVLVASSFGVAGEYTHARAFNSRNSSRRQKQSDEAVFTLAADNARVDGWNVDDRTYSFVNRSSKGFARRVLKGAGKAAARFEYYAGTVPHTLFPELEGYSQLMVDSSDDEQLQGRSESILWIGTAGVIAQTHHDRSYNFFCQLVGKKTFHLFSPAAWSQMKLFPATHPSRRQSQLRFGSEEAVEHENLMRMRKGAKAELEPGDILYVPPLWFHAVETVGSEEGKTGAVSLSVLSPSLLEKRFSEAMFVSFRGCEMS